MAFSRNTVGSTNGYCDFKVTGLSVTSKPRTPHTLFSWFPFLDTESLIYIVTWQTPTSEDRGKLVTSTVLRSKYMLPYLRVRPAYSFRATLYFETSGY